jgi:hypothetical protein
MDSAAQSTAKISEGALLKAPLLFGYTAEEITALATVALAIVTIGLMWAAWRQLPILTKQLKSLATQIQESRLAAQASDKRKRELETLRVCDRNETDPVLHATGQRIWEASEYDPKMS